MTTSSKRLQHGEVCIGLAWINKPNYANVYVGKGSPLGNPYATSNMSIETRNRACDSYIKHFYEQVGYVGSPAYEQVLHIYDMAKSGVPVNLQCYCHNGSFIKRCHAETIKTYVDDLLMTGTHPSKFARPIEL